MVGSPASLAGAGAMACRGGAGGGAAGGVGAAVRCRAGPPTCS